MDGISKVWPKWEVVSVLGQGGYGRVYKVKRETFGEVSYAAVKVVKIPANQAEVDEMSTTGLDEGSITAYFKNVVVQMLSEIKTMEKMKSASHIVAIEDYEVVENTDGFGWTIYIRMELLKNLRSYMQENPLTQDEVVKMGIDVLSALEFCHRSNVLHRDIKPDNIFVSNFGEYKLGDFGIAREGGGRITTMSQKGTIPYMAPEMIRYGKYDRTVDIYAIGLTMYEILNHGRMPFLPAYPEPFFPKDREEALARRLEGQVFPDASEANAALNAVLRKACSGNAQDRYQTATEMKKALMNLGKDSAQVDVVEEASEDMNSSSDSNEYTYCGENANNKTHRHNGNEWMFGDDKTFSGHRNSNNENQARENSAGQSSGTQKEPLSQICPHCGKTTYLQFTHGYYCPSCKRISSSEESEKIRNLCSIFKSIFSGANPLESARKMLKIDPQSAQLHTYLGMLLRNQGDIGAAMQHHFRALELDDRDGIIYNNLGSCYLVKEDYKKAIEMYEKAEICYQKSDYSSWTPATLYANHALALQLNGQKEEAYHKLEEAERKGYEKGDVLRKQYNICSQDYETLLKHVLKGRSTAFSKDAKTDAASFTKAKKHFVIPNNQKIYMIIDYSVFGGCGTGVALTNQGMYIKYGNLTMIEWREITQYKIIKGTSNMNLILRNKDNTEVKITLNAKDIAVLEELIVKMQAVE